MSNLSAMQLRPWAVIEIAGDTDERERADLIRAAYRSSGNGLVALVLRGVSAHFVDRALDPVVSTADHASRKVVYVDADADCPDLIQAAARASVVLVSTTAFRQELLRNGIQAVGVEDCQRVLFTTQPPDSSSDS